jgi:Exuperantia SAM-like domain
VTFRRLIAEAKYDMESLQKIWDEGKRDGMIELAKKLKDLKEEDQEELIELLDSHFDPEKKPVKPVVQRRESTNGGNGNGQMRPRRRRSVRGRSQNKENTGPRSNSRRKRSMDKRNMNNNNNNNNMNNNNNNNNNVDHKGAVRKDQRQQVDMNQNQPAMVPAN